MSKPYARYDSARERKGSGSMVSRNPSSTRATRPHLNPCRAWLQTHPEQGVNGRYWRQLAAIEAEQLSELVAYSVSITEWTGEVNE